MQSENIGERSLGTLRRAGSSFLDVFCTEAEPATMTKEIALTNLNLVASFMDSNQLGVDPKDHRKLTLSALNEEGWVCPTEGVIARVIESSFNLEKRSRENPDEPTSPEVNALAKMESVISSLEKERENIQELRELAVKLKREQAQRMPEVITLPQREFTMNSLKEEQEDVEPQARNVEIREVANSSSWPPSNTPGGIVGPLQELTSPGATRVEDPVERVAEAVASVMLNLLGIPSSTSEDGKLHFAS